MKKKKRFYNNKKRGTHWTEIQTGRKIYFADKYSKSSNNLKKMTIKDALIVGLFQVVALIPGISRSGSTIVGGMFRNFKRETAFNFSFLLYIPISVATTLLGFKDLFDAEKAITIAEINNFFTLFSITNIITYFFYKYKL